LPQSAPARSDHGENAVPAYVLGEIRVTDPTEFDGYVAATLIDGR
jgi:hypothetical protein